MNKAQEALLNKEFRVNDDFTLTRSDYENLPCPMIAFTWSDYEMEKLAHNIANELSQYSYDETQDLREQKDDAFWKEMEDVAVQMGMKYYEDLDPYGDEELEKQWWSIK